MAKGYGVKTIGTSDKVDSKTNFSIASNTKAFVGTSLGILWTKERSNGMTEWSNIFRGSNFQIRM
jgi:CubicO group peptidase (beta-lactamase class C family)